MLGSLLALLLSVIELTYQVSLPPSNNGPTGPHPSSEPTESPATHDPTVSPEQQYIETLLDVLGESPSHADIENLSKKTGTNINAPGSSSYLKAYEVKYVKSDGGHSIYMYSHPSTANSYRFIRDVKDDTIVIVLAKEKSKSCIVYMQDDEYKYGWVDSSFPLDYELS